MPLPFFGTPQQHESKGQDKKVQGSDHLLQARSFLEVEDRCFPPSPRLSYQNFTGVQNDSNLVQNGALSGSLSLACMQKTWHLPACSSASSV